MRAVDYQGGGNEEGESGADYTPVATDDPNPTGLRGQRPDAQKRMRQGHRQEYSGQPKVLTQRGHPQIERDQAEREDQHPIDVARIAPVDDGWHQAHQHHPLEHGPGGIEGAKGGKRGGGQHIAAPEGPHPRQKGGDAAKDQRNGNDDSKISRAESEPAGIHRANREPSAGKACQSQRDRIGDGRLR